MGVSPKKTVPNGANKQDGKVRGVSSCSAASVHTVASDCWPSYHGFPSGGRRLPATCQWAGRLTLKGVGPDPLISLIKTRRGTQLPAGVRRRRCRHAPLLRMRLARRGGARSHKIGPIEPPAGAFGLWCMLTCAVEAAGGYSGTSRQTAHRRPAPQARRHPSFADRSVERNGVPAISSFSAAIPPCRGPLRGVLCFPAWWVLCKHQNGLVGGLPRNWAVFACVRFAFYVSCTMPQPEFCW